MGVCCTLEMCRKDASKGDGCRGLLLAVLLGCTRACNPGGLHASWRNCFKFKQLVEGCTGGGVAQI